MLRESYLNKCTVDEILFMMKNMEKTREEGCYIVKGGKIYFEVHQNDNNNYTGDGRH